jgi:hypothetical protein
MRLQACRSCSIAVFAASVGLAARADAQQSPRDPAPRAAADQAYRYRLLGVYDDATGQPIEGVQVQDILSGVSMLTTATGTISLIFLPDGGSLVRLRKIGYEMTTLMVPISPADTAPVTLTLRKAAELPAMVVKEKAPSYLSPKLRDAAERLRSHAGGHFVDEETLRRFDHLPLADVIVSRMPGLYASTGPHGERFLMSARNACSFALSCKSSDCRVSLYVDGVPYAGGDADFDKLTTQDYAIAEFYPGVASSPVQFGSSPCGVMLLWRRER